MANDAPTELAPVTDATATAAGSTVDLESLMSRSSSAGVNFFFPVTIEVRETETAVDTESIVERTLERLAEGLDGE